MSKQYLSGTLSSSEKYLVEDKLLENDFYFEAMEGLENLPWDLCEKHLQETESRIIQEFSLNESSGLPTSRVILVVGLLVTSLLAGWYFTSSTPETVDLSNAKTNITSAADKMETSDIKKEKIPENIQDSMQLAVNDETVLIKDGNTGAETPALANETVAPKKNQAKVKARSGQIKPNAPPSLESVENSNLTHITVGRIVDIKGIAVQNAVVKSGSVTDTTDKSGYYALRVDPGATRIIISHLSTDYPVEIDTNQNWEIVLDIINRNVADYRPMNAANRFK